MSYSPFTDYALAVARGLIAGISAVNKFGRSTFGTSTKDLWDQSGGWTPPTTARIHDIVSTSTDDDGAPVGLGAQTIRIFGLTAWDAAEVSEDIIMDGTTNVATSNSYVVIHRMKVLTSGASDTNVGTITATAQTDATVTATITAGVGQTRMCIYGIPSTQKLYLTNFQASIGRNVPAANVDVKLEINENPDVQLGNYIEKHRFGLLGAGSSREIHGFDPYLEIEGPAIIKLTSVSDTASTTADGGFDGYLVDN